MLAHQQLLEKRSKGRIDVYFEGNSIVRRWGATDYPAFLANWRSNFLGWNAADFGIKALVDACQRKAPGATIILTGIFPRNDNIAVVPEINRINANIARFADGQRIRYVNINDKLADADGRLHDGLTMDKLHPTQTGYQIWADALKPMLTEILGPPASVDLAPPPTGDPSAKLAP
ncbi:MAG: GDSL-type esterase/lipase family protein [Gemmatimonadota bacterium]|nr:GDSL-type esterase/lipase family protein [Gemmatimonadota bacterium]